MRVCDCRKNPKGPSRFQSCASGDMAHGVVCIVKRWNEVRTCVEHCAVTAGVADVLDGDGCDCGCLTVTVIGCWHGCVALVLAVARVAVTCWKDLSKCITLVLRVRALLESLLPWSYLTLHHMRKLTRTVSHIHKTLERA